VRRKISHCVVLFVLVIAQSRWLGAQQRSYPIPEGPINAGDSVNIDVTLVKAVSEPLRFGADYVIQNPPEKLDETNSFSCYGWPIPDKLVVTITCNTSRKLRGGDYTLKKAVLRRMETGEESPAPGRLPIIAISANPYAPMGSSSIASASLAPTANQSRQIAVFQLKLLLATVNDEFPRNPTNTETNRSYLREQAEIARSIIDLAKRRYTASQGGQPPPVYFEDFELRLDQFIRDMGGQPKTIPLAKALREPRLIYVQLPQTKDSVTATSKSGPLEKELTHFVTIITDAVQGLLDGTDNFKWSITSEPAGAEVWVSRLSLKETKLGSTDLTDQTLPKAIWTFRIVWNGCSKTEEPDPFIEAKIDLHEFKVGCKPQ
jgi:hypothetical protein